MFPLLIFVIKYFKVKLFLKMEYKYVELYKKETESLNIPNMPGASTHYLTKFSQ